MSLYGVGETYTYGFNTYGTSGALANADVTPTGTLVVNGADSGATVTITNPATGRYRLSVSLAGRSVGDEAHVRFAATVGGTAQEGRTPPFRVAFPGALTGGVLTSGTGTAQLSVAGGVGQADVVQVNGAAAAEYDGIAQGGSNGPPSITLAAGDAAATNAYRYRKITIVGGTGAGQERVVLSNDAATKVAPVDEAWVVVPDNTSQYAFGDTAKANAVLWLGQAVTLDSNSYPNVNARDWGGTPVTGGLPNTAAPLSAPATTAAVWGATRAGNATAGTFGEGVASVVGNVTGNVGGNVTGNVTGSVGSLGTQAKADVEAAVWEARHSSHLNAGTFGNFVDSSISGVSTGGLSATDIAAAVWKDPLTSGDFDVSGSAGALLKGNLDAAVSTRLSTVGYAAPPTAASIATTLLATPLVVRSLDGVTQPNVSDGLVGAWAGVAAGESVVNTAYTILQPGGSALKTFTLTLDGSGNPTARG